jgi:hypothetical protein
MAAMCRRLLLIGAGFASVVVPLIIAGWQAGAAQAWWQDIIMSSTTFYVSHRGLPFPSLSEVVRRPSFGSAYLPLAALLIGACTWLSRPTAAPQSHARHTDTVAAGLLMSCLTAAMYYKGVVRVQPLHFVMSTIPTTLLLLLCAQAWQRRAGRIHAATILLGLMVIVPSAHAIGSALKRSTSEPGRLMANWLLGHHRYRIAGSPRGSWVCKWLKGSSPLARSSAAAPIEMNRCSWARRGTICFSSTMWRYTS